MDGGEFLGEFADAGFYLFDSLGGGFAECRIPLIQKFMTWNAVF